MRNCSHSVSTVGAILLAAQVAQAKQESPKIETQLETRVQKIKAPVQYEFSRTVRPGRLVKTQDGREGILKKVFRITYKDHKPVGKELVKVERQEPRPSLFLMSRAGFHTSRGGFSRGSVMTMLATAYPAMVTGTGRTKLGYRATFGHVAVDPRVIPLGSLVYVEGYGMAIASDTGSAIRGKRIDLCYPDWGTANRYGHRTVKVHILGRR